MATRGRRDRKGPKLAKMKMVGKFRPERFRYCREHDNLMKALLLWDTKTIVFSCNEGCQLTRDQAILK